MLSAAAERMHAAQRRKIRAEERDAERHPVAAAKAAPSWRARLIECAETFEHSELTRYKIQQRKKEGGGTYVAAALLSARGQRPPAAGSKAKIESFEKRAARLSRLGCFFGHFTWETLTDDVVAKYWELLGANYGEVENGDFLSFSTIQSDLRLLKAALIKFAQDLHLDWVPHIPIPSEKVVRSVFLSRSEVARLLLATRGHVWDPAKDDWVRVPLKRNGRTVLREDGTPMMVRAVNRQRKLLFRGIGRMILLCLYTGTRHDAALSLRWSPHPKEGHIDFAKMQIHRVGEIEQRTAKNMRPTSLLCGPIRVHVRAWARADGLIDEKKEKNKKKSRQTYVIRKRKGGPYKSYVDRQFARVVEAAGLDPDIVWHSLRHTAATWFAVIGIPMHVSAGLIGLGLETLMSVYLHWSAQTQENAEFYWKETGGRRFLHDLKREGPSERRRADKDLSSPGRRRSRRTSVRDRKMIERAA
ncbi:tyrosine-type recombinase/integrase [Bradyrhizobium diazoefficiens]